MATSGRVAVVGAPDTDPMGVLATLKNPSPTARDVFGREVAVSGAVPVVGPSVRTSAVRAWWRTRGWRLCST